MAKNVSVERTKNLLLYSSATTEKRVDFTKNMLIKDSPDPSFVAKEKQPTQALTSLNFSQLPNLHLNKFFTPVVSQRGNRNHLRVNWEFKNQQLESVDST